MRRAEMSAVKSPCLFCHEDVTAGVPLNICARAFICIPEVWTRLRPPRFHQRNSSFGGTYLEDLPASWRRPSQTAACLFPMMQCDWWGGLVRLMMKDGEGCSEACPQSTVYRLLWVKEFPGFHVSPPSKMSSLCLQRKYFYSQTVKTPEGFSFGDGRIRPGSWLWLQTNKDGWFSICRASFGNKVVSADGRRYNYTINQWHCFRNAPHNGDSRASVKTDRPIFCKKGRSWNQSECLLQHHQLTFICKALINTWFSRGEY